MSSPSAVHPPRPLRAELEPPPARIARLPVDERGYPVPWFVAWVDDSGRQVAAGHGRPEFRAADGLKWKRAIRERRCWVCGDPLGVHLCFVLGPMCGITRTTAEPPNHLECARWSARNRPFLSRPRMVRREGNMPEACPAADEGPGIALLRNPAVTLLWNTRRYSLFPDGKGKLLIRVGDPDSIEWWGQGRKALRDEIEESIAGGLPALEDLARSEGPAAEIDLAGKVALFRRLCL